MDRRAAFLHSGLVIALLAVLLAACSAPRKHVKESANQRRERDLQATWRGRSYHALVAKYGQPMEALSIPGRESGPYFAALYGVQDESSTCFDAFTIVQSENEQDPPLVYDYFCR